jgi:hypothetical protein
LRDATPGIAAVAIRQDSTTWFMSHPGPKDMVDNVQGMHKSSNDESLVDDSESANLDADVDGDFVVSHQGPNKAIWWVRPVAAEDLQNQELQVAGLHNLNL